MPDTASQPYHVKIEPSRVGGYVVSVSGPGIRFVDTEHRETKDSAREWAAEHVAWVKHREAPDEYDIP